MGRDSVLPPQPRADYPLSTNFLPGAGNNTLYFGSDEGARPPELPLHYGLHADRGLPIAEIPLGRAQIVVGAPPKIWRTALVVPEVSLVWSNLLPSWLPKTLYGQWWYTEDWRAYRWSNHLEITNGLEFIECTPSVAGTPAATLGSSYWCPEAPDLKIVHQGAANFLIVYYPNGARSTFQKDTGAVGGTQEGRYALTEMARKASTGGDADGYVPVRHITRTYVNKKGNITLVQFPDQRPTQITMWRPSAGGGPPLMSRILLEYRDLNAEARDCSYVGASTDPQCSSDYCYDGRCSAYRDSTTAQDCYTAYCHFPYLGWGVSQAQCQAALCGSDPNPSGCWADVCNRPVDGDMKLWKIYMPQSVAPPADRPLIYTLHYNVSSLAGGFSGEKEPHLKFLDQLEDNRVVTGTSTGFNAHRKHFGNVMQFGYDQLSLGGGNLFLKSLSYEAGNDVQTTKLEFQDYGLLQRVWTTRRDPYSIRYSSPPEVTTNIQFKDPFGFIVEKTYEPIGNIPSTPCDPAAGCNVQWGLRRLVTPEGGVSTYDYSPANDHSKGKLKKVTAIDGTVTDYTLDANGKATNVKKGPASNPSCMTETYGYDSASQFPNTPRSVTATTAGQTSTTTFTLCEGAGCPGFELGSVLSTTVQYPPPGGTLTEATSHTPDASGKIRSKTTVTDGVVPQVVADLLAREPVLGLPQTTGVPGARTNASHTAGPTSPNNPATGNPNGGAQSPPAPCDSDTEFCGGAVTVNTQHEDAVRPFPAMLDAEALAAAGELNLTAFASGTGIAQTGTETEHGALPFGATGDSSNSTEYDVVEGTGMPVRSTTTKNGVTIRTSTDWLRVETAFGHTRMHPNATVAEKAWIKSSTGAEVFLNGTWSAYSKDQFETSFPGAGFALPMGYDLDNTYYTHLGPLAQGHFKADGTTPSFPDGIMLEDPRQPPSQSIGCPAYRLQGPACPGLYGFICRQNFLRDSKTKVERNEIGRTLYNSQWWYSQCSVPNCPGSFTTLYCRNPKSL